MKTKTTLFILFFFFIVGNMYSQYDKNTYYYYQGKKIAIEPDYSSVTVTTDGKITRTRSASSLKIAKEAPDYTNATVIPLSKTKKRSATTIERYNSEVSFEAKKSAEEYFSYMKEIEKQIDNVQKVSPNFKVEGRTIGLTNNFYIRLHEVGDIGKLEKLASQYNMEIVGYNEYAPLWYTVACTKETSYNSIEAANIFHETGLFETTEPEFRGTFEFHSSYTPGDEPTPTIDEHYDEQWALHGEYGINARKAWNITLGEDIKVAVFDQGIDVSHPDLAAGKVYRGFDTQGSGLAFPLYGNHGTQCASIVGAIGRNGEGIIGVAPNCLLYSISFANTDTPQQLAHGFYMAISEKIDVISNSWFSFTYSSILAEAVSAALNRGRNGKGMVVVFASGNQGTTDIKPPASAHSEVLVVGATDQNGRRVVSSWASNYSNSNNKVLDVMAPGMSILTASNYAGENNPNNYGYFSGTSYACPHVSGIAALLLSVRPGLYLSQVNDIIQKSAKKVHPSYNYSYAKDNATWSEQMGHGLVDAYEALRMVFDPEALPEIYHPDDKELLRGLFRQTHNGVSVWENIGFNPNDTLDWYNEEDWVENLLFRFPIKWDFNSPRRIQHLYIVDINQPFTFVGKNLPINNKYININRTSMTSLDLSGSSIISLSCYNNPDLTHFEASNSALQHIYIPGSQLNFLDLSSNRGLLGLFVNDNKLEQILMPEISENGRYFSGMDLSNNNLKFSTLPLPFYTYEDQTHEYRNYVYAPQATIDGGTKVYTAEIDLSSEYNINGNITSYYWYHKPSGFPVDMISLGNGKFKSSFANIPLTCEMTNPLFPDLVLEYEVYVSCMGSRSCNEDEEITSISEFEGEPSLILYPNPVGDMLYFNNDEAIAVYVYNQAGALMTQELINPMGNISVRDLNNGTYLVKVIESSSETSVHNIIVNK